LANLLFIFFIGSSLLRADDSVRTHAKQLKEQLLIGQTSAASDLLNKPSASSSVEYFNEAFLPFFQLFIESKPDESLASHESFSQKYGALIDLADYNEHYLGMREAFFNAEKQPQANAQELYIKPLPGPKEPITLLDVTLLNVLGVSNRIDRVADQQSIIASADNQVEPEVQEALAVNLEAAKKTPPSVEPHVQVLKDVEEVTPPEPAKEEPVEVAAVEVAEETSEQSSQWWLWLIGLLVVVVGGLGFVLRRKS